MAAETLFGITLSANAVYKKIMDNVAGEVEIRATTNQRHHANETTIKALIIEILEADVTTNIEGIV